MLDGSVRDIGVAGVEVKKLSPEMPLSG